MTSKEALKMLETRCRYFASDELEIEETYEARKVIDKDLEVLDILKGHYHILDINKNLNTIELAFKLEDKEFNLIKEFFRQ